MSRVKGLLEAAGMQILRLGLEAGLLPVSHRMWGILSGSSKEGRSASKAGGSGQGMESGRQDRGRRQTRPETAPCSADFLQFSSFQHELKKLIKRFFAFVSLHLKETQVRTTL